MSNSTLRIRDGFPDVSPNLREEVRRLQRLLVQLGFRLDTDGLFGRGTDDAVRAFQSSRGLLPDGIVGRDTWGALAKGGNAVPLPASTPAPGNSRVEYTKTVSDQKLRAKLSELAMLFGWRIKVHSGDRNHVPSGGSQTSLHLQKRAADFHVYNAQGQMISDKQGFKEIALSGLVSLDYELIWHGTQTSTGGPHLHLGRYGNDRNSQFKIEGTTASNKGRYIVQDLTAIRSL
ncbi:peptidoglycan-binding domain-containing protein [Chondromyces crocatus]|uniref:Peptidoglycan binding-like domain-containing protein n=1 Tax=Chondromyces crocatus TaxID=52 RepID=A0A0K1E8N8_CHOCO|nr:peptidoglycan-binding domain-containing protein [Chondromyces crocatus]AKT37241.1 uncharacterized protein CMC5_013720 [Chondromyces crocatus]